MASETPSPARWGTPVAKLDERWTALEARLALVVLIAEICALCLWVTLKGLSARPGAGDISGLVLRVLITSVLLGMTTFAIARRTSLPPKAKTWAVAVAIAVGAVLGRAWVNVGVTYFSNFLNWLQDASVFMLVGGLRGVATRFTLWLALLGASIATAKGKHINVDVVMRFLTPRLRTAVAITGWLAASLVCISGAWGFLDHIAIEDFKAPADAPCTPTSAERCETTPKEKLSRMGEEMERDWFLFWRQASLDARSLPRVMAGARYDGWMTGADWNEWMTRADWSAKFPVDDVKGQMASEDQAREFRSPQVNYPGGNENIRGLLVRDLNLVFPFGLFVIGIRFLIRVLLALSGHVKVDPDAAHDDADIKASHPSSEAA